MSKFYEETLLKEEFNLVCALQRDSEFSKYVKVLYEDRVTGVEQEMSYPVTGRYPEKYKVTYQMPVYSSRGQLRTDWLANVTIQLEEAVLTNKHANNAPHVNFDSNFRPFNNHVNINWICAGNAWMVAKENGLWHFIISIAQIINQEAAVSDEFNAHLDKEAFDYWIARGKQPVTNIKWPFGLLDVDEKTIIVTPKLSNHKSSENKIINVIAKKNQVSNTINFIEKKQEKPKIQIIAKKK